MRFILILILLIGICGASDYYGDINIRQGSNLSYVDGGGSIKNVILSEVSPPVVSSDYIIFTFNGVTYALDSDYSIISSDTYDTADSTILNDVVSDMSGGELVVVGCDLNLTSDVDIDVRSSWDFRDHEVKCQQDVRLIVSGGADVSISHVDVNGVDAGYSSAYNGILAEGAGTVLRLSDSKVHDCYSRGINIRNSSTAYISRCEIFENGASVFPGFDGIFATRCKELHVIDSNIYENGEHGIYISSVDAVPYTKNVYISNCNLSYNGASGAVLCGQDVRFVGNNVSNCGVGGSTYAIRISGENVWCSSNKVDGGNVAQAIRIYDAGGSTIDIPKILYICENILTNIHSASTSYERAIEVVWSENDHQGIFILNNYINDTGYAGIYINDDTPGVVFGNSISYVGQETLGYGIYLNNSNGNCYGNRIFSNTGYGIYESVSGDYNTIYGNALWSNSQADITTNGPHTETTGNNAIQ